MYVVSLAHRNALLALEILILTSLHACLCIAKLAPDCTTVNISRTMSTSSEMLADDADAALRRQANTSAPVAAKSGAWTLECRNIAVVRMFQ